MAEDTEASGADPSMEEILASIRKIISDENPVAEAASGAPEVVAAVEPVSAPAAEEVIVELTQMVQEDGSIVDLTPVDEAPIEPAPIAAAPAAQPLPPVPPAEPLVSAPAANSAASALSSLANTVEIERLSSAPSGATFLGNGSRTLEDMTVELMRPLLKDWLDKNLPAVVERLVQKEIERIARRN